MKRKPNKKNQPATKKDVNLVKKDVNLVKKDVNLVKKDLNLVKKDLNLVKKDLNLVKKDLNLVKNDLNLVKNDLNLVKNDLNLVRIELRKEMADLKFELKGDIALLDYRMDKLEKTLALFYDEFKDFKNKIYNLLEPLAGEVQTMRNGLVMQSGTLDRHEESLDNHKNRILKIENHLFV